MKSVLSTAFLLSSCVFGETEIPTQKVVNATSSNWAVLVAGSNGYYNYRHQSDVCHSYQILTKLGGFPEENVIVMIYNDIVNNSENPIPGKLFNEPGGVDVYGDIKVSYSGDQVTAQNFLNVIQGIKEGDTKNGPVLESKKGDNVFIYYSDHGATGLVAMPTGDPLYATDLMKALNNMNKKQMYNQLVFYLEACESGSMFNGILPNNTNIFATTAATPNQPSYAFYYNETLETYMADEYSVRWMQDSTKNWDSQESLLQQYKDVAAATKESQPQKYGDEAFDNEPIEDFEAYQDRKGKDTLKLLRNSVKNFVLDESIPRVFDRKWVPSKEAVSSRDVKLATLQHRYLGSSRIEDKIYWASLVEQEIEYRLEVDLLFDELVKFVTGYVNIGGNGDDFINAIKYGHILPTNWECLKYVYSSYEAHCEDRFSDYSLKYVNTLVNLCETFDNQEIVEEGFKAICQ